MVADMVPVDVKKRLMFKSHRLGVLSNHRQVIDSTCPAPIWEMMKTASVVEITYPGNVVEMYYWRTD
jgi:hypothetical protein